MDSPLLQPIPAPARRIFKYPLRITDRQTHLMPRGAKILCVQMQNGFPMLWAQVDETQEAEPREIAIYGTGHSLPTDPGEYIGTLQQASGSLIWHVFALEGK